MCIPIYIKISPMVFKSMLLPQVDSFTAIGQIYDFVRSIITAGEDMKRSNYSKESLVKAVEEYKNGATSSEVSLKYGVPSSTVRNHNSNSQMRVRGGRPPMLTNDQEQHLIKVLKHLETIGLSLTKNIITKISCEYVTFIIGKPIHLGRKWLNNFLNRWKSELKIIKQNKIKSRHNYSIEVLKNDWFENLEFIIRSNNMLERPYAIFSCVENRFTEQTAWEMMFVNDETKSAYKEFDNNGKAFTSLICANATGEILPPLIIYSAKTLDCQWATGGPQGSSFAITDSGWLTTNIFVRWFKSFIEHTKKESKPLILIMNNYDFHISIELIDLAKDNQILLSILPTSCISILQSFDTGTFSSTKELWKSIKENYLLNNGGKTICPADVPALFKELNAIAFTPERVIDGFSRTGLWPVNANTVKENIERQQLAEKQLNQFSHVLRTDPTTTPLSQNAILIPHDQNVTETNSTSTDNNEDELNCTLNKNKETSIEIVTENSSSSTRIFNAYTSSNWTTNITQLRTANENFTEYSPCMNIFDSLDVASFDPYINLNSICFNDLDLETDELNFLSIPIDINCMFTNIFESSNNLNVASIGHNTTVTEDGAQQIFDFNTLLSTCSSHCVNVDGTQVHKKPVVDTEEYNDQENRTYADLTSIVNVSNPVISICTVQSTETDKQYIVHPTTACQSISLNDSCTATDDNFFQHHVFLTGPSRENNRKRQEEKYIEVTSNATTNKKRKLSNENNFMCLSQKICDVTNFQVIPLKDNASDQFNIDSIFE